MHESIWSVPGSCQVRGAEKIKKVTFPHFLQERLDSVDHLLLCFPSRQSFGSIRTFFAIAFCPETQRLTSQQSEAVRQAPLQRVSGERNRLGEGGNTIGWKLKGSPASQQRVLFGGNKKVPSVAGLYPKELVSIPAM